MQNHEMEQEWAMSYVKNIWNSYSNNRRSFRMQYFKTSENLVMQKTRINWQDCQRQKN